MGQALTVDIEEAASAVEGVGEVGDLLMNSKTTFMKRRTKDDENGSGRAKMRPPNDRYRQNDYIILINRAFPQKCL